MHGKNKKERVFFYIFLFIVLSLILKSFGFFGGLIRLEEAIGI